MFLVCVTRTGPSAVRRYGSEVLEPPLALPSQAFPGKIAQTLLRKVRVKQK
jgi:hypothetical protein